MYSSIQAYLGSWQIEEIYQGKPAEGEPRPRYSRGALTASRHCSYAIDVADVRDLDWTGSCPSDLRFLTYPGLDVSNSTLPALPADEA